MTDKRMRSRRRFIGEFALLTAAGALAPDSFGHPMPPLGEVSLDSLSFADFSGQENTFFRVDSAPGGEMELQLSEARRYKTPSSAVGAESGRWERFHLSFRGSAGGIELPQGTHTLAHARLGRFALFLVPVSANDGSGSCYEAIFNRSARD